MKSKKPPFEVTSKILQYTADIAELVGRITSTRGLSSSPILRRTNRIRTIHGSLAIEQNTLSLEQVTAVLNGKHVIAPPKDVAEVKNAYEIYEQLDRLDPYHMDDLLKAHGVMMRGILSDAGQFREKPAGVVDQDGRILHFGTLPKYIPDLVIELMNWTRDSDVHLLIKSSVFHYEFELIHPFLDGNGRVGRLWHTLLLSKWNPVFAWLPVESIIHDRQREYYAAINESNDAAESTAFIEFMLSIIREALEEAAQTAGTLPLVSEKDVVRWQIMEDYLQMHPNITNADIRELLGVSSATANRILVHFTEIGRLQRFRFGRTWGYSISKSNSNERK